MTDQQIEKVARAMCTADARDPDEVTWAFEEPDTEQAVAGVTFTSGVEKAPRWQQYRKMARRQIAAHQAIFASAYSAQYSGV